MKMWQPPFQVGIVAMIMLQDLYIEYSGAAHLQNLIGIVSYFCHNNYCPGFFLDSTLLDHTYCSNSATLIAADNPPHLQHSPYIRQ